MHGGGSNGGGDFRARGPLNDQTLLELFQAHPARGSRGARNLIGHLAPKRGPSNGVYVGVCLLLRSLFLGSFKGKQERQNNTILGGSPIFLRYPRSKGSIFRQECRKDRELVLKAETSRFFVFRF